MDMIVMELSTVLLLAAIILLLRRQRGAAGDRDAAQARRLEDVARNAELTQQTCMGAWENLHKSLVALEQRTASAERRLGSLIEAPAVARREHYEAAALLLGAGHDAAQVSSLLDLPLPQVEMIGEIKNILNAEGGNAAKREPRGSAKAAKKKPAARAAKTKVRPILLSDVVETEGAMEGRASDRDPAFDGAAA